MRSRYSAFVLELADYLLETWHPESRPSTLELDPQIEWRRLQIVDTVRGTEADADGVVEFRAAYRVDGVAEVLHERSAFERVDGLWRYRSGQILDE